MIARIARLAWARFYSNLLLPNRIADYAALLDTLANAGYVSMTMRDFAAAQMRRETLSERVVLLRHDIDTNAAYTPHWLAAEARAGFVSTSYFRLRTWDTAMMRAIEAAGSEASYHYEELASHAKEHGLTTPSRIQAALPSIRDRFCANLARLRDRTGLPMATVASHGDFANRALGMTNAVLIDDETRRRAGLLAEVYEPLIQDAVACRASDQLYPNIWRFTGMTSFGDAITQGKSAIEILTHPRHWVAAPVANMREDLDRIVAGWLFRLGRPAGRYTDFADRRHSSDRDQKAFRL